MVSRDRVLAFDVNETLLDLAVLDPLFTAQFGDAGLRPVWFAQMLQVSFVGGLTGRYVDFTTAQRAALEMLARRAGSPLDAAGADRIVGEMRALPPHPDVADALARLAGAGFRMVALTNSPLPVVTEQLGRCGLTPAFAHILSADQVQALKPAAAAYHLAARATGVPIGSVRLVAAHGWDISGALAAGCAGAFVARGGAQPIPVGPRPDISGADLAQVADQIIDVDR